MESRLRCASAVECDDCDFVLPRGDEQRHTTAELTGWETVVFVVEDEDDGTEP